MIIIIPCNVYLFFFSSIVLTLINLYLFHVYRYPYKKNGVWDGLNEATWYTEEKTFTLNYVCMDGRSLKKVVGTSILDLREVIDSDHVAIRVEIEWKGVMGQRKNKKKAQKKGGLNKQKWEVFCRRMNGKEFENMYEMNSMMTKEGCEMEKSENWQEDRRWMTDDVRARIIG